MSAFQRLQQSFTPTPGYLNAATMGLPPVQVVEAMTRLMGQWQSGEADALAMGDAVESSRAAYAAMVNVPTAAVATGALTSVFTGTVATSLRPGAEVLVIAEDFTSMTFPFLVQVDRGIKVRQVARQDLARSITAKTDLVVFSLAQSACGSLADVDAVLAAATEHDAMTLCDTTQAAGWLPIDAARFDITVCATYKWLCQPRGTAYMTLSDRAYDFLRPNNAGWYAGEYVWGSVYGPEMDLATDGRRFDIAPAWFCWAAGLPAMELFSATPTASIQQHNVSLANEFRAALGLELDQTPVVTLSDPDGQAAAAFATAGAKVSHRAGKVRVAFHVWNTAEDVQLAVEASSHSIHTAKT